MKILAAMIRCPTCGLTLFAEPTDYQGDLSFIAPSHPHIGCPRDGQLMNLMAYERVPDQVPPREKP